MNEKFWIASGAFVATLAVALGAFGAHGLEKWVEDTVSDPSEARDKLENWQTASRYQMYHSVGLILLGILMFRQSSKLLKVSGTCFLAGILLFSGVMYAYVLTGQKSLGMVLPLGGLAFMAGWSLLGFAALSMIPKGKNGN